MSASPSADNQPAPGVLEADTTTSVTVPTSNESQMENNQASQNNASTGEEEHPRRWAKSSSPLSQYDEDARGERRAEINSDEEDTQGGLEHHIDTDEDEEGEDMDMDVDDDSVAYEPDDMDIIEDDADEGEEQHNQENKLEESADRGSESTVQPHLTPSRQRSNSPGEHTPKNDGRMEQVDVNSDDDEGDENIYDDDADERHSSVTSSTIPLTSLDDSPNQRHRITENHTENERQPHLLASSSSEVLHRQSHIGDNLVESSTLSSLPEGREAPPKGNAVAPLHDDDLTDLSDSEGDEGNEDEGAEENDNEDLDADSRYYESDENDENVEDVEDEEEGKEEDEENAEERHNLSPRRQASTNLLVLFFRSSAFLC